MKLVLTKSDGSPRRPDKQHAFNGVPGLMLEITSRKSGAVIQVFIHSQEPLQRSADKYRVYCCRHKTEIFTSRFGETVMFRTNPDGWCEGCQAIAEKRMQ